MQNNVSTQQPALLQAASPWDPPLDLTELQVGQPCSTLFLGNVKSCFTEEFIMSLFPAAPPQSVALLRTTKGARNGRNPNSHLNPPAAGSAPGADAGAAGGEAGNVLGYCFLEYASTEDAVRALSLYAGTTCLIRTSAGELVYLKIKARFSNTSKKQMGRPGPRPTESRSGFISTPSSWEPHSHSVSAPSSSCPSCTPGVGGTTLGSCTPANMGFSAMSGSFATPRFSPHLYPPWEGPAFAQPASFTDYTTPVTGGWSLGHSLEGEWSQKTGGGYSIGF